MILVYNNLNMLSLDNSKGDTDLSKNMVVYTHPDCSYSEALKGELDTDGVQYEEIDLSLQPDKWEILESLTDGERITPVTVEGDLVTVGFHGVG